MDRWTDRIGHNNTGEMPKGETTGYWIYPIVITKELMEWNGKY